VDLIALVIVALVIALIFSLATIIWLVYRLVLGKRNLIEPQKVPPAESVTLPVLVVAPSSDESPLLITSRISSNSPQPRIEFGADGIRGIAGQWPLVPQGVMGIGQALGRFLLAGTRSPGVVIGRDTRPSSESLSRSLIEGMRDLGIHVIDLGVMTTPGIAFLTRRENAALGVIISASHNPFQYNGIKLVGQYGLRLQREDEIEIESLSNEFAITPLIPVAVRGQQTDGHNLIELYTEEHVRRCPVESLAGFKIVLDCANGAAARVAPEVFARLGAEIIVVNDDVSGMNKINYLCGSEHVRHHPHDLVALVRQHGAAYGFAFDGDGDRLVAVDSEGHLYDGDDLLFVLATYYHSKNRLRGNTVITTHSANMGLDVALGRLGIKTIRTGKGDKSLEAEMWHGDYLLGSEQTGNIILNDGHHTAADAVYAALVLAGVLVGDPRAGLSDRVAALQKWPQVLASVYVQKTLPLEQIRELEQQRKRALETLGHGCRVMTWYSTTEPGLFRVLVEANPDNVLEEAVKATEAICQAVQRSTQSESNRITLHRVSSRLEPKSDSLSGV
jgi:phosphoglucosamine mutase